MKPTRNIIISVVAILTVVALIATTVFFLRQPGQADYNTVKDTQISDINTAREDLQPAVNKYLAAYKQAQNASGSSGEASRIAKPEYDAYKQAEAKARSAVQVLETNRVANERETGTAIQQLKQTYESEVTYFTGLVESYPEFTLLFSDKEKRCSGIFIGGTNGLSDRKQKLDAAAKTCYQALDKLKQSKNVTYVDYAKKIERRVKLLQQYAAATTQAEQNVKTYEPKVPEYQKKIDDAVARNASDSEYKKITAELKEFNAKIAENKADFDFAAKRYLSTVQELPTLFDNVYSKDVPAKIKNFKELHDIRIKVITLLVESKLADQ